ncbi:MAG: HAD family hydrolase [Pseudobutyrivibrio sp.]|nr:HAD family hydrolase [Pseudobutyrivibrio sp.]
MRPEKEPAFPFNKMYKDRLRLGIPALFRFLEINGFDIWVYSSNYYSIDYIKSLFKKYHTNVTVIVTGTEKKNNKAILPQKLHSKYRISLHIDDETIVFSLGRQYGYNTYQLDAQDDDWKEKILARAQQIKDNSL